MDFETFRAQAQLARTSGTDTALYEEALALYIGDLLPADRYEEWTEAVREELKTLHNDLLMELSQLYESQGKIEPAVERLERLLQADPVREEAHRGLMRLFALSGSRDKALTAVSEMRGTAQTRTRDGALRGNRNAAERR